MKPRSLILFFILPALLSASCQKPAESLVLRFSEQRVEAAGIRETEPGKTETETVSGSSEPAGSQRETASELTETEQGPAAEQTEKQPDGPAEPSAETPEQQDPASVPTETETTRRPDETAQAPAEPATKPAEPTADPSQPPTEPMQSTEEPAHSATEPTQPTQPTQPTESPSQPSTEPTQPSTESLPTAPSTTETETSEDMAHPAETAQRIEILTLPDKTVYDRYYERISTEGLSLRAFWTDGYERVVTDGYALVNDDGLIAHDGGYYTWSEGEHLVIVKYGEGIASFTVSYHLAADAPLSLKTANDRTVFYTGEYTENCINGIFLGNQNIRDAAEIMFDPERITGTGNVTVRCISGEHIGEMTLTVLPGELLVPNQDDFEIFRMYYNQYLGDFYQVNQVGTPLSIGWLDVSAGGRPVLRDVIPAEEFVFEPAVLTSPGTWPVTVSCRGFTVTIMLTAKE